MSHRKTRRTLLNALSPMAISTGPNGKPTLAGKVVSQILVLLVCVVAPGALTAVAPVSWLHFERQSDHVVGRANVCMFFVIPYQKIVVDPVTEVSQHEVSGSYTRHRRSGTDKYTQAETTGYLSIIGPNHKGEVYVTPHNIDEVTAKVQAFLKDSQAKELKMFVVANWKFSVIGGGFMCLLTVLYAVGVVGASVQFLLRAMGIVSKPGTTPRERTGSPWLP